MKREEEIKQYCAGQGFPYGACSSISSLKADIATDAIKWADKTMIEKACEWLEQHQEDYDDYDAWKGTYVNFNRLILDFKKSMEE